MAPVIPSPNRSRPPPFHELDDEAFEELCCALLDKEPGVRTADRYGAPRQLQFGIDILGQRVDEGVEVVSCKCCNRIKKGEIPTWGADFLRHWEMHWQAQGVRRFVLAVAAEVKSKQRLKEIEQERARFAALGVAFEVWAPRQLQERLRPYHGIATQYLGEPIADQICGRPQPTVTQPTLDAVVVSQLSNVQAALAAELDQRLDSALSELKRGNGAIVDRAVDQIQADAVRWTALPPDAQARVVRLRAARELERGKVEHAEQLADEADRLAGAAKGRRLRAAIAARRDKAELALRVLDVPESGDDRRLHASLLLLKGNLGEALEALPCTGDAEDEALKSLILAAQGRREHALDAVERAEQLGADLLAVRRAGIRVRYSAALSPVVPLDTGAWPDPIPLGLVREDDVAQQRLQEAHNIANATLRQRGLDRNVLHDLQTWRLACLANQRTRSPEAEAYASELLSGGRPHAGAVAWSLARGFDFDRPRIARSLVDLLESSRGEPEHLTVLLALELDQNRPKRARQALADHGRWFAGGAEKLLSSWEAIISARLQEAIPAEAPLALRLQLLLEEAESPDDWQAVVQLIQEAMDGSPKVAYQAIDALAGAGKWDQVRSLNPFLVQRVATADAVTLACFAAHETADLEGALALLDAHTNVFPNGTPPLQLRRLRVSCLQRLGRLPEAARLADSLVGIGGLPDLFAAIDVRLAAGDVRGAVPYFRIAAEREDLPAEAALRFARMARQADPIIALDLWRKAQSRGLPQHLAALAATTAFELGLDLEAGATLASVALQAEAGSGSLRKVGFDELLNILRERQHQERQIEVGYLSGEIPVHVAFDVAGGILADSFARAFAGSGGPLLIRDGSRGHQTPFEPPATTWRLRLDITAVLIAHHLDLLDTLEQQLAPVQLPFVLPSVLREMALRLRPIQPSWVRAQRDLVSAVDDGRVGEMALGPRPESACAVANRGGLLVDYTPSSDQSEHKHLAPFANLRRVTDALAVFGQLSVELVDRGRRALGHLAEEAAIGPELEPGQTLVFSGNTLQNFSAAGLLDALVATFRVVADSEWVQMARNELNEVQRREGVAVDLDRLCDRIAHGILRGVYEVLPATSVASRLAKKDEELGLTTRCIDGLFSSPLQPNEVVWIDDRRLTRFQRVDDAPVVGVVEVLQALRAAGLLGDDAYFDRLRRLRDAGAQFVPLRADEVMYHLDRAPLDAALVDTPALRTLRRSIAATALLEEHLRLPPFDGQREGQIDELPLLQDLWRLSALVIEAVWRRSGTDVDRTRACADWAYENLSIDRLERAPLDGAEVSRRRLYALRLAQLVFGAIQIIGPDEADETRRREAYYEWFDERILEPRLNDDPELLIEVVGLLNDLLFGMLEDQGGRTTAGDFPDAARVLVARLLVLLPERIRVPLLESSPALLAKVSVEPQSTVELGGLSFAASEFFAAAAQAIETGSAQLTSSGGRTLRLDRMRADTPTLRFSGAAKGQLTDPALDLLRPDPEVRRACLVRHSEWIDRAPPDAELRRSAIVEIPAPHERMLALDDERRANAEIRYQRLVEALARSGNVPATLFEPPPVDVLVRHMRFDDEAGVPFADLLERAARRLVAEGGPAFAIARLVGLPVRTSPAIIGRFDAMELGERTRTVHDFDVRAASPLRRARAIELLRAAGAEQDRLITSLERLLANIEEEFEAFTTVIAWTERMLERQLRWRELSCPLRLATVWAHAERIFDILLASGAPPTQITSVFKGWHPRALAPWLLRDPADTADLADPAGLSPDALIYRFVGLAVGDKADTLLSASHLRHLQNCMSETARNGTRWPKLGLLASGSGPDALGSFLADDFPQLRSALQESGLGERLLPAFASSLADHAITSLAQKPEDIGAWTLLLAARRRSIAPEERDRIVDLLYCLDLRAVAAADEPIGLVVALWAADISRFLRSTEVSHAVEKQIIGLCSPSAGRRSGVAASAHGADNAEVRRAALVGDAAIRLCRTPEAQIAAERLASIVPKLVANCQIAAPLWRTALEQIVRELPFSATAPLWPVLLRLRTRSDL